MRCPYSATEEPAALCLQVRVSPRGRNDGVLTLAKIDTGACVSVIPETVRGMLRLKPRGVMRLGNTLSKFAAYYPRYGVSLAFADLSFDIRPISRPREDMLIGRDVLNQLVLNADGPLQIFELTG